MHRGQERFLAKLEEYAGRIGDGEQSIQERGPEFAARAGDILIWRFGRVFSHGAIAAEWPRIIHASFPAKCVLEESAMGGILERRPMRVYSYWAR
jgi:cell wall-associated NlpC family hydrolase